MPDRRSPRPDDGATLPPVGARTPGLEDLHDPDEDGYDRGREPNYLVRRALAVGAVVAVIAVAAVVVGRLVGDDGNGASSGPSNEWNTVVALTADEIRLIDPDDGDVVETFDADDDLLDAQSLVAEDVLVTMTDAGRIVITDLDDGSIRLARAGPDEALRISRENQTIAIAGSDDGGDITLIDTAERTTLRIGRVADFATPFMFPSDVQISPSGTHAAATNLDPVETVVIDIANETAAFVAGDLVAIGDESVVTAQRAGRQTELEFYDLSGERLGQVDVPTPAAAMLVGRDTMLLVDADGTVRRADAGGSVDDVSVLVTADGGEVEIEGGLTALGGRRLVTFGSRAVVVIDDDGQQIAFGAGRLGHPIGAQAACVVVGTSTSQTATAQLELDGGAVTTAVDGGVVATTSNDACTASLISRASPGVIADGEVVDVDADAVVAIAPDGRAVAVVDGRDTELVIIGDDGAVEIADEEVIVHFANR